MHTSELFRLYVSAEKSFNQATLIDAKVVRATDNGTKTQVDTMPFGVLLLAPICFMVVWWTVVFIVSKGCKIARAGDGIVTINRLKQVPCKNCRCFNNSHYLKCAVHPSSVLTTQALNCSDYWPQ